MVVWSGGSWGADRCRPELGSGEFADTRRSVWPPIAGEAPSPPLHSHGQRRMAEDVHDHPRRHARRLDDPTRFAFNPAPLFLDRRQLTVDLSSRPSGRRSPPPPPPPPPPAQAVSVRADGSL